MRYRFLPISITRYTYYIIHYLYNEFSLESTETKLSTNYCMLHTICDIIRMYFRQIDIVSHAGRFIPNACVIRISLVGQVIDDQSNFIFIFKNLIRCNIVAWPQYMLSIKYETRTCAFANKHAVSIAGDLRSKTNEHSDLKTAFYWPRSQYFDETFFPMK